MTTATLHVRIHGAQGGPLASRFEDVAERLAEVERLHLELDGSFVWVGPHWQWDGMIYDHAGCIQYVELKGAGDLRSWQRLIRWIADPHDTGNLCPITVGNPHDSSLHELQKFEDLWWPG